MASKANGGNRAVTALVGFGATFAARKVIQFAWKKITGKEPPEPEDPQVGLGEALAWAVAMAVGVQVARMLAVRAATRTSGEPEESGQVE
jgi:Protein of unknown function (DUF4235)